MANKLYPPYIEGTLPAFYLDYDLNLNTPSGAKITIPFTMNPAINQADFNFFVLRMRSATSGTYIIPVQTSNLFDIEKGYVTFILSAKDASLLTEGLYYKVQLAYSYQYIDDTLAILLNNDIGYYSTVGVIKCVSKPNVSISNLDLSNINFFTNDFVGLYDQTNCKDKTEKVYSYEFMIYDDNNELYYTTGEQLHNHVYDTEYSKSIDSVQINNIIPSNKIFSIQYKVITLNGLELYSPLYKITNRNLIPMSEEIDIIATPNNDYGVIEITFKGKNNKYKSFYYFLKENDITSVYELINTSLDFYSPNEKYYCLEDGVYVYQKNLKQFDKHKTYYARRFKIDDNFQTISSVLSSLFDTMTTEVRENFFYGHNLFLKTEKFENDIIKKTFEIIDKSLIVFNPILGNYYYKDQVDDSISLTQVFYGDTDSLFDCFLIKNFNEVIDETEYDQYKKIYIESYEKTVTGNFILARSDDSSNYSIWQNIDRFHLDNELPSSCTIKDFTIEHGRKYLYSLQQYNSWGVYSSRIYPLDNFGKYKYIEAQFEDAFLYDGEKILKIGFNPEINSFKTTLLEQKTNTLGNKYPYITRNGATEYKEFTLSGLLSYELDFYNCFTSFNYGLAHRHSTPVYQGVFDEKGDAIGVEPDIPENALLDFNSFSDQRIVLERDFKLNVLDWLNNGKPKLFKSPYEGNYIIRLMNVSLNPINELGRILHKFNSTAYEIADFSYNNLLKYDILNKDTLSTKVNLWKTFELSNYDISTTNKQVEDVFIRFDQSIEIGIEKENILSFIAQDLVPGTLLEITTYDSKAVNNITIGATGSYTYPENSKPIKSIIVYNNLNLKRLTGSIHCYYNNINVNLFDSITKTSFKAEPLRQFIGVSPFVLNFVKYAAAGEVVYTAGFFDECQDYNFRDLLRKSIKSKFYENGRIVRYSFNPNIDYLIKQFDPYELTERINVTFNNQKEFKIKLMNVSMARFRVREKIPVYHILTEQDKTDFFATNQYGEKFFYLTPVYFSNQKIDFYTRAKQYNFEVSTSPYGEPHPIRDLIKTELLDPTAIFEVFIYNTVTDPTNPKWESVCYFDAYYGAKTSEYNTNIAIGTYKTLLNYNQLLDKIFYFNNRFINIKDTNLNLNDNYIPNLYYKQENNWAFQDNNQMIKIDSFKDFCERFCYIKNTMTNAFELYEFKSINKLQEDIENNLIYYIDLGENIDLSVTKSKVFDNLKDLDIGSIKIGNAIIAELTYDVQENEFYVEQTNGLISAAKARQIEAKNFYNELLDFVAKKDDLKYKIEKYEVLNQLYGLLLYGKNNSFMTSDNLKTLSKLLEDNNEYSKFNFLKLYKIQTINSNISDKDLLEKILNFKEQYYTENKNIFNTLKLYKFMNFTYLINKDDIQQVINNPNKNNIEFDYSQVFYQIFQTGEKNYFVVNDIQALNNKLPIFIQQADRTWTIGALYLNTKLLEGLGYNITVLNELNNISIINDSIQLLTDLQLQAIQESNYFIYSEEIPYNNGESNYSIALYEEDNIKEIAKNNISDNNEDISNKINIIKKAIADFSDNVTNLETDKEKAKNNYILAYNQLINEIATYNSNVTMNLSYQLLCYLLQKALTTQDDEITKENLLKIFINNENEANIELSNLIISVEDFYKAGDLVYKQGISLKEHIQSYNAVINDNQEETSELDDYLSEQVLQDKKQIIILLFSLKYYYEKIIEEENSEAYAIQLSYFYEDLYNMLELEKYYLNYKATLEEYILNTITEYQILYNKQLIGINNSNHAVWSQDSLTDFAKLSSLYDDLTFLKNMFKRNTDTLLDKIKPEEIILRQIDSLIDPLDDYGENGISNVFYSYNTASINDFNKAKDTAVFKYRKKLTNVVGEGDINLENPLPFFIANPLSKKFTTNKGITFFETYQSLTDYEKENIMNFYQGISSLIIEYLKNSNLTTNKDMLNEIISQYLNSNNNLSWHNYVFKKITLSNETYDKNKYYISGKEALAQITYKLINGPYDPELTYYMYERGFSTEYYAPVNDLTRKEYEKDKDKYFIVQEIKNDFDYSENGLFTYQQDSSDIFYPSKKYYEKIFIEENGTIKERYVEVVLNYHDYIKDHFYVKNNDINLIGVIKNASGNFQNAITYYQKFNRESSKYIQALVTDKTYKTNQYYEIIYIDRTDVNDLDLREAGAYVLDDSNNFDPKKTYYEKDFSNIGVLRKTYDTLLNKKFNFNNYITEAELVLLRQSPPITSITVTFDDTIIQKNIIKEDNSYQTLILSENNSDFLELPETLNFIYPGIQNQSIPKPIILMDKEGSLMSWFSTVIDDETISDQGLYATYLNIAFEQKQEINNNLKKDAEHLLNLYTTQYNNYTRKYETYKNSFDNYSKQFATFMDNNKISESLGIIEENGLEYYRLQIKRAWWDYLNILDDQYNNEDEEEGI